VTREEPGEVLDGGIGAEAMRRLRSRSVCVVEVGLTAQEIAHVKRQFGFEFADDHREFLSVGLPVNAGLAPHRSRVIYTHPVPWPDWRNGDRAVLRQMLDWLIEGVLLDVEHNQFWFETLGPTPVRRAGRGGCRQGRSRNCTDDGSDPSAPLSSRGTRSHRSCARIGNDMMEHARPESASEHVVEASRSPHHTSPVSA
jgi:hypothetical protein